MSTHHGHVATGRPLCPTSVLPTPPRLPVIATTFPVSVAGPSRIASWLVRDEAPEGVSDRCSNRCKRWAGTLILAVILRARFENCEADAFVAVRSDKSLQHCPELAADGHAELADVGMTMRRHERPVRESAVYVHHAAQLTPDSVEILRLLRVLRSSGHNPPRQFLTCLRIPSGISALAIDLLGDVARITARYDSPRCGSFHSAVSRAQSVAFLIICSLGQISQTRRQALPSSTSSNAHRAQKSISSSGRSGKLPRSSQRNS